MGKPARPARFLKIRYTVALLIAALVALAGLSGFAWADRNVTLLVDGQSTSLVAHGGDVASLLQQADVTVGKDDLVSPDPSTPLTDGEVVVVRHAVPVTLDYDGKTFTLHVVGGSVADALVIDGLDPTGGLTVTPSVETSLQPGMTIVATDVFVRVSEEQIAVPYETVVRGDASLPAGAKVVVRKGRPGTAIRVWQALVTGGVQGKRTVRSVEVSLPRSPDSSGWAPRVRSAR